jgi:alpha-1,3-rhamnosyl/mannosyltransferase
MPSALRGADGVIAVSETSRREAIRLFDLDPERVFTVHHGCAQWALDASARFVVDGPPPTPPPLGDRPYIANVSALYGLKNHRRLIEAFGLLASRTRFPHDLVLAGGEADVTKAELAEVARRAGVGSRVQILGRYPQEDLPALYANADAIAYPSLYETFGLPVLEAFAFRRPLLTSVISGCGEVAGNAAVKVDPRSVESIAAGLEQVVGDVQLREQIVEAGTKRLEDFSWARCAHGTLTALHAAVARRSSLGRRGARPSNASVS